MAVGLALAVCGCTTTQTTAARLQLNDDRIRASELPSRVAPGDVSPTVSVTSQKVLTTGGRFTAVVTVKNAAAAAVSDLPISVGYRLGAKLVYLNATATNYFDNHLPAIAAHGTLTWVDTGSGKLPAHARILVLIGAKPTVADGNFTPPEIAVDQKRAAGITGAAGTNVIAADLTNRSSIPQYQLPVYAVITRGRQVVGASDRSITDLAGGAKAVVRVPLPAGADSAAVTIRVEAPATIFK